VLPIRQRAGTAEADSGEQKGDGAKAWSPQTDSTSATCTTTDSLKYSVKNTFIDVDSPEVSRIELHKGAQSCTARFDEQVYHSFKNLPTIPDSLPEDEEYHGQPPQQYPGHSGNMQTNQVLPLGAAAGAGIQGPPCTSYDDSGLAYNVKNTFIDIPSSGGYIDPRGTQSCTARVSNPSSTPLFAPPTYAAPLVFQQDMPLPPPPAPPSAQMDAKPGMTTNIADSPGSTASTAASSPDKRPMPSSGRLSTDSTDSGRVIVKNTFIEFEETPVARRDRYAMSCTARFSEPAAFPCLASPTGAAGPPVTTVSEQQPWAPTAQVQQEAAAVVQNEAGVTQAPSMGSKMHGVTDASGQPMCQPCAWFYKDSGCLNGAGCRYCHLCPQGELKNRKKAKIQRLRAQDAAAAAAAGESNEHTPKSSSAASPVSMGSVHTVASFAAAGSTAGAQVVGGRISLSALLAQQA